MSDIYIPGVKSRFDTSKMIEDLMKLERVPKERAEKNVETLTSEKSIWQSVGRRISALRETSRALFSFQNPFTERIARSGDESVLSATATREAAEQERSFVVDRIARADRFISRPLDENVKIDPGEYAFHVGKEDVSFSFRGGSLKEFVDALNRRNRNLIRADSISVQQGTKSLVIESLLTGSKNTLGFSKDSEALAIKTGLAERIDDAQRSYEAARGMEGSPQGPVDPNLVGVSDSALVVKAGGASRIPFDPAFAADGSLTIEFETAVVVHPYEDPSAAGPPPGPSIPSVGGISYGGITIENDASRVPLPPYAPPPAPRKVDDPGVLSLVFADGSTRQLPPVQDDASFKKVSYRLSDFAGGKSIVGMDVVNRNTHRDVSIRSIGVYNPDARGGMKPLSPISVAQDALLSMDGIAIQRDSNTIKDLIPGVTVNLAGESERPVKLTVEPDRESAKDAIIAMVGSYNRLLAEVNVLTRKDDKIVQELSYLDENERKDMEQKAGILQGDPTLNQLKTNLQRAAATTYPTAGEREMALLAQLGISTDARQAGSGQGYDPARLRGYLEINEKTLDAALKTNLPAIKQLFGNDTDGDLITDSGFAFTVDNLVKPYVETGGIIALKSTGIDSRIAQENRRIETMDKQLAAKENELRRQYGLMEGALNRMEQTSGSIDQFNNRSNTR